MKHSLTHLAPLFLSLAAACGSVGSQSSALSLVGGDGGAGIGRGRGGPGGPGRHGPPQEAVDACSALAEGAACSFTHDGNAIDGSCRRPPDHADAPLACAPADMQGPRDGDCADGGGRERRGPPPEALTACEGKAAGDACTVTLGEQSLDGTCRQGPDGQGPIACAPANMPERSQGHGPPPEALAACEGKAAGDACTVTLGEQSLDGTCRQGPDGQGPIACAPANMPEPPQGQGPPPGESR